MRLTDISDTDIRLDQNGQPIPDNNGECVLCTGEQCWMQDIWIEMLTEESELLWEDEEGIQAYGFGLTDYLNAEIDEAFKGDFSARIISKLICNDRCQEVNQVTTNFLLNFLKPSCKGFGVSVPGFGHSDIRGLVTYRSMVRREPHRLSAWITDNCANIV